MLSEILPKYKKGELREWESKRFGGVEKWTREFVHDNGGGLDDDQLEPEVEWPIYFSDFSADIVAVEKSGRQVVDVRVSEFQDDYYGHNTTVILYII